MKKTMSVFVVLMMAFTLVAMSEAGTGSSYNDKPAVLAGTHNVPTGTSVKDADNPGHFPTGTPYPCIASPAYLDYTDARAVPCPTNEKVKRVPEWMGSPGL